MTTINKQLFDDLISQHIDLGRYSSKQAADIVDLLKAAKGEILAQIAATSDNRVFTKTRLNKLLKEISATISDTYAEVGTQLHDELNLFVAHAAEVSAATLATQMPLEWSPYKLSKEQLAAIVSDTPITAGEGKLLFGEIIKGYSDAMVRDITGVVRMGMVLGESAHKIASDTVGLLGELGTTDKHIRWAHNMTHTMVQSINNNAAQATMANNSEVLKGWTFISTFDSKTCSQCFSNSGKAFPLGQGPIPTLHVGCRCYQAPLVKSWKELGFDNVPEYPTGTRATSTGVVKADLSFNDWLKGQPRRTQDELLGPTRGKMFADGKIKLDKFTDASGKLLTLEQLKVR